MSGKTAYVLMSSKGNKQRIVLIVTVLLIAFAGGLVTYVAFNAYNTWCRLMGPVTFVSKSHGGPWEAVFLSHGALMGRKMTLIAVPDTSRDGNDVVVGVVSYTDRSPYFREACWSSDGTVIAVRTEMYMVADANEDKLPFTHAYDFVEKEIIAPPKRNRGDDLKSWMTRAKKIERLVLERGGEGSAIASYETIYKLQKKVSRRKWRRWREILKSKSGA